MFAAGPKMQRLVDHGKFRMKPASQQHTQISALQAYLAIRCFTHAMHDKVTIVQVVLPDQEHLHQHYRHNR